ncbi:enoyl-CoA hydratase [Novosphingobium umbonatum]|uniref:Enoyl-CoA hydratase n=1 Tax=Novosphingobium umbonatum TaxID=1908524 RepID=A0A437N792_9SPHN|nr:enoyl-CoA hydratase-related protein [Novosphingobium umbonatum]RVU05795.1 enoyl-CoA hydratase [Novosphingobium umbonatum]
MEEREVLVARHGGVALITLNRPKAGNTFNMALATALELAIREALADPDVRVLALTGAGKLFCGGGDVGSFASAGEGAGPYLLELANAVHRSVKLLASSAKPVVTIINGAAAGAGLSLAIAGDVVVAGASAHFSAAYSAVGLTPDGGMSWLLPRLIGWRRAQEMLLTNRRVSANEAEAMGLVTRMVPDEEVIEQGLAMAEKLARGPVAALGKTRLLLAQGQEQDLSTHLDKEAQSIAEAVALPEAREGIAAFLERRKPDFVSV